MALYKFRIIIIIIYYSRISICCRFSVAHRWLAVCTVLHTVSLEIPAAPKSSHHPANKPANDEELDLLFDSELQCFYDPRTCKYYKLIT